jgi:hypothetical protein
MQASFSKLLNQLGLVTLQELLKAFFLASPATLGTNESTPIMRIPMQNFQEKLTLKNRQAVKLNA